MRLCTLIREHFFCLTGKISFISLTSSLLAAIVYHLILLELHKKKFVRTLTRFVVLLIPLARAIRGSLQIFNQPSYIVDRFTVP